MEGYLPLREVGTEVSDEEGQLLLGSCCGTPAKNLMCTPIHVQCTYM